MSTDGQPRREQRLQRAAKDTGAAEDIVFWQTNNGSSGSKSYHVEKDCSRIKRPEDLDRGTRKQAKLRWRQPCGFCCSEESDE